MLHITYSSATFIKLRYSYKILTIVLIVLHIVGLLYSIIVLRNHRRHHLSCLQKPVVAAIQLVELRHQMTAASPAALQNNHRCWVVVRYQANTPKRHKMNHNYHNCGLTSG